MQVRALIGTSLTALIGMALGAFGTLVVLGRFEKSIDRLRELRKGGAL